MATESHALHATAVILACVGGLVTFWGKIRTTEARTALHLWLIQKWTSLGRSSWLQLPSKVISILAQGRADLSGLANNQWFRVVGVLIFGGLPWILAQGLWMRSDHELSTLRVMGIVIILAYVVLYRGLFADNIDLLSVRPAFIALILLVMWNVVVWLRIALSTAPWRALLIFLFLAPLVTVTGTFFANVVATEMGRKQTDPVHERITSYGALLGLSMILSFVLTFGAYVLGFLFVPGSNTPRTIQMLFSNAAFDGLTLMVTMWILETSVTVEKWVALPLAVLMALAASAAFAFASLWVGLYGTDISMNLRQLSWVFCAHRADGARWEIGPLFWIMHTTFVPTFAYLAIVLLCWMAKSTIAPARWIFKRGTDEEVEPITSIGAFILAVSGIFEVFALFA